MSEVDLETGPVTDAAQALAAAIKSDPRFTDWREVTNAFESNDELKKLLMRFQELAGKAQGAQQGGSPLADDEVLEIQALQKNLQEDVLFIRHNKATGALLELLHDANQAISSEIQLDFAGNVAATSQ